VESVEDRPHENPISSHFNLITVESTNLSNAISWILRLATSQAERPASAFHLINSYSCELFSTLKRDNPLLDAVSVNLPDGFWLARYLRIKTGHDGFEQVRGPDLFKELLSKPEAAKIRHAFVGSTDHTLEQLGLNLKKLNPALGPSLFISPPFVELDEEYLNEMSKRITNSNVDLIWVGMGTPKQDYLANVLASKTGVTCVAVGAAFDFLAGTKPEAPRLLGHFGLEWAFRLATEPKRLWRRYLVGNFNFVTLAFRDFINR
jgi:N-acetylglucosaminyldiphosphoundecaprenol N-acetyl-beta-D-mannosaminyltransferase